MATSPVQKRKSKTITKQEDIDYLCNTTDLTKSFIMDCFGEFEGKRRFNTFDIITVPVHGYGGKLPDGKEKYNTKPFTTTVGRLIFNKYIIATNPELFQMVFYIQEDFNKKAYSKLFDRLGYALIEDEISLDSYKEFCMRTQAFMPYISILAYNHSDHLLTLSSQVEKKKNELIEKNKEAIEKKDMNVIDALSKELLEYAKDLVKDDPAMDMFRSGGGGSVDDNFKTMFVMRGAIANPDPAKGYDIIFSNYLDGISKDEYTVLANSLAAGPYARAKKTELGGYWEKLFSSAVGHTILLEEGSDCKTKRTITYDCTEKNIDMIMYNYVVKSDGSLVEITSKNKSSFIGKKVKLRFSSMCESKNGICSKCAGTLYYRLGIRNVGVATSQIPSKLKLLSMKAFHDDQVRLHEMDPMRAFFPDN